MRECESDDVATYNSFRLRLDGNTVTEEMWQQIMEEDEQYTYNSISDGEPPAVQNEVNVFTTSGVSSPPEGGRSEVEDNGDDDTEI